MRSVKALAAVVAAGLVSALPGAPAAAVAAGPASRGSALPTGGNVQDAYAFLNQMMDLYATGPATRLVQSFTGGVLGKQHDTASQTYDDALLIDAYLAEGTPGGLSRARVIGNALLYVQANDPARDGRIRAAYAPGALRSQGDVQAADRTSDLGAMAWAGLALAQLHAATGGSAYLRGAERIGRWIQANCRDTRGAGGYTGGYTAAGRKIEWKSTEQNTDLYALFRMLATQTGAPAWSARAAWSKRFVTAMWTAAQGRFYTGTTTNGKTPNDTLRPEDVNSWSYLAFHDASQAAAVSWDVRNLAVSAGEFSGVSFCQGDRSGVWFEGTAHLADALLFRNTPGDAAQAAAYLSDIGYAQAHGPNNDGKGIIAASKDQLGDCGGGYYYASLHTGATAWYVLAATKADPFLLITRGRARPDRQLRSVPSMLS